LAAIQEPNVPAPPINTNPEAPPEAETNHQEPPLTGIVMPTPFEEIGLKMVRLSVNQFFLITDPFSSVHQLSIIYAGLGYPRQ
jgi:hypothetical protein